MSTINNITNTFSRTRDNNAKFGFYPTDLEIVKKEISLISINGVSSNKNIPIADFTAGDGSQLFEMYNYLHLNNVEPIAYFNEITQTRYNQAKANYEGLPNFHFCNSDLFRLKCRHKNGRKYDSKTIVINRNNPPYGEGTHLGERVRLEEQFFLENDRYVVEGGIHILEVPITTLINNPSFMVKIAYRYKDINIFKFPIKEFNKFKQVVLFGVRKKDNSKDTEVAEEWIQRLKEDNILTLDDVTEPIYFLTDEIVNKAKEINVYRDADVNEITLSKGLLNEIDELFKKENELDLLNKKVEVIKDEVAIIERSIGHRALELSSGKFNKVCGDVLLFGYTDKKIETTVEVEDDKEITTETEIIVAGIEITNKNGEIIRRES